MITHTHTQKELIPRKLIDNHHTYTMKQVECLSKFSPKNLAKRSLKKTKSSSSSAPPRGSMREEELREVFCRFDSDRDGKISPAELRSYFASFGEYMSYEDAEGVIEHLDSDNDKLLDFEDFLRLMGGGEEEDLRAAFGLFEWENTGRITARSLQRVLGQLGDPRSYDDCVAMIRVFDPDGKGEIGYPEFQRMMIAPA